MVSYEGRTTMRTQMYLPAPRRLSSSSLTVVGIYPCASVHLSSSDAGGWTSDGITLPGVIDLEGTISNPLISECVLIPRLIFQFSRLLRLDSDTDGCVDQGLF